MVPSRECPDGSQNDKQIARYIPILPARIWFLGVSDLPTRTAKLQGHLTGNIPATLLAVLGSFFCSIWDKNFQVPELVIWDPNFRAPCLATSAATIPARPPAMLGVFVCPTWDQNMQACHLGSNLPGSLSCHLGSKLPGSLPCNITSNNPSNIADPY